VSTTDAWHLTLRFGPDSLRNGMDPLSFLRYLSTMGSVTDVVTVADALPEAAEMDPETCYLAFEVEFVTEAPKADIEAVFDFVREDSDIRIVPAEGQVDAYVRMIQSMPESDRIGDILVGSGAVTEQEMERALRIQQARTLNGTIPPVPIGEVLVGEQIIQRSIVDAALNKQRKTVEVRSHDTQTIRVDASRLDKLIDLVGELVIAQASTGVRVSAAERASLMEAQSEVMRLVDEVRHSALSLRMVPIGTTLRRFERVVRDVCVDLGKEVTLLVTGGDAEMDKALVERIGDPLLHLVRNSLDHGIEPPDERARRGKSPSGTLRLNAYHDAGNIVIEVADDGRGLDRDRIIAKAVERGLVAPGTVLADQDVYELIFEPGFSTVETVSSISGRGVGMDVVRKNVTAMRGSIEVETTQGVGTTFRIRLPLTLAIIDGFLVGVGSSSFIVPLDRVTECVELPPGQLVRDCMNLRGEVLPFIRLRSVFGITGEPARRQNVVVVEQSGQRTGLVVDALLGEFQTVIKPLGTLFSNVRCISGSTILGNGEVALILDVGPLVADHAEREHARHDLPVPVAA
jgi:two-component system chemotaxis sensor kinase CheA